MSIKKLCILMLGVSILASLLIGCKSSSKKEQAPESTVSAGEVAKVDDATCAANACHGGQDSRITGASIIGTYQNSVHARHPEPIGCQDCHGGGSQHFGKGPLPYPNPAAAGWCFNCHQENLPPAHFNALSPAADAVSPAMYLATNTKNCNNCHNPHDPMPIGSLIHTEYASSLHGDVNGVAWATEDFKENKSCIRCHTTTGFIGFSDHFILPDTTFAEAGDVTREVLSCNACHYSYDFKNSLRLIGAVTAPFNIDSETNTAKNPTVFPDVSSSNLCVACHSGRESGQTITSIPAANFSNTSFKNSHYIAAAGMMFVKSGFISFVDPDTPVATSNTVTSTYGATLTSSDENVIGGVTATMGVVTSTHRNFGSSKMLGDHGVTASDTGFLTDGPCVTCHMPLDKSTGIRHHSWIIDGNAYNNVCTKCHTTEVLESGATVTLTAANFLTVFVEEQQVPFDDARQVAITLLQNNYNIKYDASSYPYFYDLTLDPTGKTAVKDWTRGGTVDGMKLMGACYNLNLLTKEPHAYVHARTYTRRLIYDTIDFLDDKTINMSTVTTALGLYPTIYIKGPKANTGGTTESVKYLDGYNRTSNVWNNSERP